jgi:hypothetical protein
MLLPQMPRFDISIPQQLVVNLAPEQPHISDMHISARLYDLGFHTGGPGKTLGENEPHMHVEFHC